MLAGNAVAVLIFIPGHIHGFFGIIGDNAPHRLNCSAHIKISVNAGAPEADWLHTPTVDLSIFAAPVGAHDHDAIKHCLGQTCLLILLCLGYILVRYNM